MSKDKKSNLGKKETGTGHGNKKITFFDSVEQMNEYDYKLYANMTPKERLEMVYKMRNAIWPQKKMRILAAIST